MPEDGGVAVEEVLLVLVVEEEVALRAAQQGVGVALQRVAPRLEPGAADVEHDEAVVRPEFVVGGSGQRRAGHGDPTDGGRPGERQPCRDPARHGEVGCCARIAGL